MTASITRAVDYINRQPNKSLKKSRIISNLQLMINIFILANLPCTTEIFQNLKDIIQKMIRNMCLD